MRVEDFLRASARRLPGKTALVTGGRRLELRRARPHVRPSRRGAWRSRDRAGRPRRRVHGKFLLEAVVAILAVLESPAPHPVSPVNSVDEIGRARVDPGQLRRCRHRHPVPFGRHRRRRRSLAGSVKLVVLAGAGRAPAAAGCLSFEAAIATNGAVPGPAGSATDPATLIWTSEATHLAEGVMRRIKTPSRR